VIAKAMSVDEVDEEIKEALQNIGAEYAR